MKYKDDENFTHEILEEEDKVILISEIAVFGEFFKKKYKTSSTSKTYFKTLDEAKNDLRMRTKNLTIVDENNG